MNNGIIKIEDEENSQGIKEDGVNENAAGRGKDKQSSAPQKKNSALRELFSWVMVFVVAAGAALFINTFIIANSTVPTGSMEDTIQQGDRVIGSRLSYVFGEPERGDVVIFRFGWQCRNCKTGQGEGEAPETCPVCGETITKAAPLYYLKRTIGLPGDKIEIVSEGSVKQSELSSDIAGLDDTQDGDAELMTAAVYVNGEKLDESYLKEPMLYTGDMSFEVPEGCYFFLGDNRNNSLDARYWDNPYIESGKIIAKVMFRYYPHPSLVK